MAKTYKRKLVIYMVFTVTYMAVGVLFTVLFREAMLTGLVDTIVESNPALNRQIITGVMFLASTLGWFFLAICSIGNGLGAITNPVVQDWKQKRRVKAYEGQ
ncbi:hypothetical protein [Bacillus thuringiensis]|uniref:hypothetical protein n=1 Tax=Bacillus thuringiensis TaxID=1428 RepID=UPI000BFBC9AA|nr:hypothetical protein [Bacillus thuringiensis]PGT90085.1 hypothetical protein COD17_10065 [Bacillus thuringiensis]